MNLPRTSVSTPTSRDVLVPLRSGLAWSVRAAAFWLAIVLPFLYLPLMFGGLKSGAEQVAFLGLLVLNVITLIVGHEYRR